MTELTPELNLIKGDDPDDSADYLTISLAQSLDILDGLFNASTGHNHNGAHQGGALTFQNLTIGGTLTVQGALLAQGATTIQNTLLVTGATTLQSTLDVSGTTRLRSPVTMDSTLNVAGVATLPTLNTTTLNAQGITGTALQINGSATITGNATINGTMSSGAVNTGTVSTSGRITSGTDMVVSNGNLYLHPSGDTLVQRAAPDALRIPSTLYFGPGVSDTYIQRAGPIGGSSHPLMVTNPGSGLWLLNEGLTFYTPSDPQGGGQTIRAIGPSNLAAGTYGGGVVHIAIRLQTDGDIWCGTYVHGISFIQTSDMALKQNVAGLTDADCMLRIRRPMPVYSYEIPPPVEPGEIAPTPTDIGFSADDVFAQNPEFAALNAGDPVGVNYANMAAVLWGALRDLDARCQAKGV